MLYLFKGDNVHLELFHSLLPSTRFTVFHKLAPSLCFPLLFHTSKALYVAFTQPLKYGMNFDTPVNLLMVFSLENTSLYFYSALQLSRSSLNATS